MVRGIARTCTPCLGLMVIVLRIAKGSCPGSSLKVKRWYSLASVVLASCTVHTWDVANPDAQPYSQMPAPLGPHSTGEIDSGVMVASSTSNHRKSKAGADAGSHAIAKRRPPMRRPGGRLWRSLQPPLRDEALWILQHAKRPLSISTLPFSAFSERKLEQQQPICNQGKVRQSSQLHQPSINLHENR